MDFNYSNLFKPSYLEELCKEYRLRPSKEYGQNYLISDAPIHAMVEAAGLENTDNVVEVGPGFGVLTMALSPKVEKVVAFEIEQKIKNYWDFLQKEYKNVEIIWGNVLQQASKFEEKISDLRSYKVIANVPYQITSQIFRLFLEDLSVRPTCIVTMVQKEVAERMCAKRGELSLLALSVQYYGTPRIVSKVSKGNFWPMPAVDSAVIAIDVNKKHLYTKEQDKWFFEVVRAAFSHKRKQAWKNISDSLGIEKEVIQNVLRKVVGNEQVRAQDVVVEEWVEIAMLLHQKDTN